MIKTTNNRINILDLEDALIAEHEKERLDLIQDIGYCIDNDCLIFLSTESLQRIQGIIQNGG